MCPPANIVRELKKGAKDPYVFADLKEKICVRMLTISFAFVFHVLRFPPFSCSDHVSVMENGDVDDKRKA
eukprot:770106-Karenia_brevis.AAC.1